MPDAQPDQGRELGREVRRVDDVAEQGDDAQRAAERQQRRDQREGRRHERSEREQQDDRGGEDARRPPRAPGCSLKRTISAPGPPCSTWSDSLRAVNAAFWTFSRSSGSMSFVLSL